MPKRFISPNALLLACAFLFFALAGFFVFVLRYDFFHADVSFYWEESTNWRMPFNEHPPLYALAIAFLRTITFGALPPITIMWAINLAALLVCVACLLRLLQNWGVGSRLAALGALMFSLWPLVGLTYTVIPLADIPAMALTLAGLVLLQRSGRPAAGLLFGLAIITHKGVWPVIGLVMLLDLLRGGKWSRATALYIILALLPVTILWVSGSFYHHSITWLMERSVQVNTSAGGGFPVLDGLLGTFREGGSKGLIKGLLVLFFLLLALGSLAASLKARGPQVWVELAIALAVVIMFLFSSAGTVWGPVRFSRFLVIPIILRMQAWGVGECLSGKWSQAAIALLASLFVSQLVYAWYTAEIFYGS